MTFYCGIDLHSKKSHVCIIDKNGKKVKEENLNNDFTLILQFLKPFGKDVHIAIESTINWYWIVDGLQEAGYDVKLAHTLGLHMITGAKVKTDRRDAFKLAKLLRMGEIPEAYIYLMPISQELKDYCVMILQRIDLLSNQIDELDTYLKNVTLEDPKFKILLTLPGVLYVLGLTIYYEIGDISRFDSARQFASYSRLVPGISQSSDKIKRGKGSNQGNHYLKWAFTQAANIAVRYYPTLRKFRDKHANKRKGNAATMVANCILAHKIANATFHMMKEGVPFGEVKLFG